MNKLVLCAAALVCVSASAAIPQSERNALLAIYNGNNGPNWTYKDGWNGAAGTECQWYGVGCDDAETTVTRIGLGSDALSGSLPVASIAALPNLEELDLSGNQLTGQIPPELATLTKLKIINLEYNALTGAIPSFVGSLTNLTSLNLHANRLTGALPPEVGNLVQLQTLDLGWNQLSGAIPTAAGRLSALQYLDLDLNALTGSIPSEIGQLRNLQYLSLSVNQLQGPIPHEIGNLSQLAQLLLAYNGLSGTIPDEIYTLRQLTNLGLEGNQLTGPISPKIGNLTALTQLDLNTNQLSGPIPVEITTLGSLTEMNLQENALTGQLPAKLDGLVSLVTFDVGSNQLTGSIPTSIGTLSKLENLALYQNNFGGTIPDALKNLPNLTNINLEADNLSGPIPDWLLQFPKLTTVYLGYNQLTGPIPSTITGAVNLTDLDLSSNQLTGQIPPAIGNLQKVTYLALGGNELGGPIPDSLWTLSGLIFLDLASNQLTGALPAAIHNLTNVRVVFLHDNRLSGALPPEIGSLTSVSELDLGSNEFTGTLPRELGQLKNVQAIDFSANNFRSPVPPEITGMTAIVDGGVDFAYNAFSETDPTLVAYMNRVQFDHDFAQSQTVVPANIAVSQLTDRSAVVSWTPIRYYWDEGGYRVFASLTPGGTPVAVATTATKEIDSITVRGLQPSTTYYFTVATVSHPHDFQHNLIVSDSSAPVSAATGPRQTAPADIVITATPAGLVELDGVPQNEDSFTLTNFGDAPSAITLNPFDNTFYDFDPKQFTLAGGASQTVKVTAIANQPPGFYYGGVQATGDGTTDDDVVTTTLLSAKRTGGSAIAEPSTNRIEISAPAGIDPVGQITFRNKGTANLIGVLVADQPWLVPNNTPVTIEPGTSATAGFKIVRARRPAGLINGALTGTLSLIYVADLPGTTSDVHAADTNPSSISISKVTVVDVSKPDVSTASAPGLSSGEVAYFVAGLLNRTDANSNSTLASGLSIMNALGSNPINDVRLYYASSTEKAVATLTTLGSAQGVSLANVVANVYSPTDPIGSLQVRSVDWQNLVVNASFLRATGSGTLLGDMPVFRSDRALAANDKVYLTGIAQSATVHATAVLEEIAGNAAAVSMDFYDANGALVQHRDVQVPAANTIEISDVPANAAAMVVANTTANPTGVLAYVRMADDTSGDTWSVVDWSRLDKYLRTEALRIPLVMGGSTGGGKRRAVKHSDAVATATSLSLFNSGAADARARLSSGSSSKEVSIAPHQTLTIASVGAFLGANTSATVTIEPVRGELIATSRIASGGTGTAVPIVPSQNGLRIGQSQVFSGLEDSAAYRTDYGFVETGGATTTIRATILLSDARSLFTTVVSRDFQLAPGAFLYVNELVKSILGPGRSSYGDLHNLQLQLDVVDGSGSVLPFVTMTDTTTGDMTLRLN